MSNDTPIPVPKLPLVVVVAEKDASTRATLAGLLSCDGCRVFQAEDLNAAISWIGTLTEIAVLFVDIEMPGWDSLVQHTLSTAPDAFVMATAEHESVPEISELRRHGINLCLRKPLLYAHVRWALSENVVGRRAA
jgi:DNA-binding NtrC family response regulator